MSYSESLSNQQCRCMKVKNIYTEMQSKTKRQKILSYIHPFTVEMANNVKQA